MGHGYKMFYLQGFLSLTADFMALISHRYSAKRVWLRPAFGLSFALREGPMSKTLSVTVAAALVALAGVTTIISAKAADVSTSRRYASNHYCQQIWRCGPSRLQLAPCLFASVPRWHVCATLRCLWAIWRRGLLGWVHRRRLGVSLRAVSR